MNPNGHSPSPDIRPSPAEIIAICRTDLEILYNLHYLLRLEADTPEQVHRYAELIFGQVRNIDDVICSRLAQVLNGE